MADLNDYNTPTVSNTRVDVQDTNRAHHARAITLNPGSSTNRPVGAKLAELISNIFTLKSWNGTSYDTWLSISNYMRGLLGSVDQATARDSLGAVGLTGDETIAGEKTFSGTAHFAEQSGGEGGEVRFAKGTDSTALNGTHVAVDIIQDKFRVFETGGSFRGAYINLADCAAAVGTNLLTFKFKNQYFVSSPTTLTAATHASSLVTINGVAATLPLASTCPVGTLIQFYAASTGSSVLRQGSDNITSNGSITSVSLAAGEAMMLVSDGLANWIMVNRYSGNQAWTSTNPTPFANSGAFTSALANVRWRQIGRQVYFTARVTITTNGTANGSVGVPMPVAAYAGVEQVFVGRVVSGGSAALIGVLGGSTLTIRNFDATYPGANGYVLVVGGVYEADS
jgi:hypothetical protein